MECINSVDCLVFGVVTIVRAMLLVELLKMEYSKGRKLLLKIMDDKDCSPSIRQYAM
jgi:hypothetical protein